MDSLEIPTSSRDNAKIFSPKTPFIPVLGTNFFVLGTKTLSTKDIKQHPFWKDTCKGNNLTLHLGVAEFGELRKLTATIESFSNPSTYTVRLYKWCGGLEIDEGGLSEKEAKKHLSYWLVLYKKTATLEYEKNQAEYTIQNHPFWQDTCKGSNLTLYLNINPETPESDKLVATVESFLIPPTYELYRKAQSREMIEKHLSRDDVQDIFLYWMIQFEKTAELKYEKHEVEDFAGLITGESRVQPRKTRPLSLPPKLPPLSGLFRLSRESSPRSPGSPSRFPLSSRSSSGGFSDRSLSSRNSSMSSLVSSTEVSPRTVKEDPVKRSSETFSSSGPIERGPRSPVFRRSTPSLPLARTNSLRAQVLNEMLTKNNEKNI